MSKSLVIVESPTKARTISRYLGKDVTVLASMGHVRDLPESTLGVDVGEGFRQDYVLTANGKRVASALTSAAKKADDIYLATDPDREGEAIAWHLVEMLRPSVRKATFHRVAFHEITPAAVKASFANPGSISEPLVAAQQARRVLDRIVGYQVSPMLWKDVAKGTSAGRVQSVALRLVCEREREVQAFKPEEYWNLQALFRSLSPEAELKTRLALLDGKKPAIPNADAANALAGEIEAAEFTIAKLDSTPRRLRPQPPFITSTLQQAAGTALRFSTTQTMRLAQQLYEGVELGAGGPAGLITYMRTDSVNVATEAQTQARAFIAETYGAEYVPATPNRYRSRQSAQEAHEAIRPTDVTRTPEAMAPYLTGPQLRLYQLIWNRFVASQMEAARQMDHSIDIEAKGSHLTHRYTFRASARETLFPGFLRVWNVPEADAAEESNGNGTLPALPVGTDCRLLELEREQCFTTPPPRYTEATLVKALEQNGVGRPSTYAATVNTIQEREYVAKEKSRLVPTPLGFQVNDYLVQRMPDLFDVGFTAEMEGQLDRIEEGEVQWQDMLGRFYKSFCEWLGDGHAPPPSSDAALAILRAFPADTAWLPAVRRGRRLFDDAEFHRSLVEQLEAGGKSLSERQWKALLALAARYAGSYPAILEAAAQAGLGAVVSAGMEAAKAEAQTPSTPNPDDLRLLDLLREVRWSPAVTRGGRTYDDAKFYRSLRRQADGGAHLSEAQRESLKRLITRYAEQIPNYTEAAAACGIVTPGQPAEAGGDAGAAPAADPAIHALLELTTAIPAWDPPTTRGRRTFDDKEFAQSLTQQFQAKGTLSERQVAALRALLARYAERIPGYAEKAAALALAAPAAAAPVRANCPKCGAILRQRVNRRNGKTFYGCSAFPKCRYLCNELPPPAEAT